MRLIDLLDITNDSVEIIVHDREGTVLSTYDGRNSIGPVYNDRVIEEMNVWKDRLFIFLS